LSFNIIRGHYLKQTYMQYTCIHRHAYTYTYMCVYAYTKQTAWFIRNTGYNFWCFFFANFFLVCQRESHKPSFRQKKHY